MKNITSLTYTSRLLNVAVTDCCCRSLVISVLVSMHKVELLQHSEHGGQAVCGSLTGLGLRMCMIGAGCGPRALAA